MQPVPPADATPPEPQRAAEYERLHVHSVYSQIAPHFAATRYAPWPRVDAFLAALPKHAVVADVGCGNGKYMVAAASAGVCAVGTDYCAELAQFAAGRDGVFDAGVADVLNLPFREGSFDAALCIAVVHHLATWERRVEAWREIVRVLRKDGLLLAYVWALERPQKVTPLKKKGVKMLTRRFDTQDVFVPWHMRHRIPGREDKALGGIEEVHRRYYHVYKEAELEEELSQVGVQVVESFYDHQNWCAIVRKVTSP